MTADHLRAPSVLTLGQIGTSDGQLANQHQLVVLLAYLAHEGPTDRATLATLFWPHAGAGLNSLSSALSRIRRVLPGVVTADRHQVSTSCSTDAQSLREAIEAERHDAYQAHHGPFLAGFQLKGLGLELEEWIFDTRDALADAAARNAVAQVNRLAQVGDHQAAADASQRALELAASPTVLLDHVDLLYSALNGVGRPEATRLLQLAEEHDVRTPSGATEPATLSSAAPGLHGRSDEIADLHQALRTHRVVNLFGIGGVGKTRLVRAFVQLFAEASATRTIMISFDAGDDGVRLLGALAEHLEITPSGDDLLAALGEQLEQDDDDYLVVIDDVAPSMAVVEVLEGLAELASLSVVVVSRRRLESERIGAIPLRGLEVAGPGGAGPAVRLMRERAGPKVLARMDGATFDKHAHELCTQLSGLPLAIELTAAWLRIIPIEQVGELLSGEILDETPPGEETSLRRIIEHSWNLLPEELQAALSGLSVIEGSFDRTAAQAIAGVGLRELTDLHDHSLIDVGEDGRLRCHALVRTFAQRQMDDDPGRRRVLLDEHRSWYLAQLASAGEQMKSPDAGDLLRRLRSDQSNLEAAWLDALAVEDPIAGDVLGALDDMLLRSGQILVAQSLYRTALELVGSAATASQAGLAAAIACDLAWVEMLLGNTAAAQRHCSQGFNWVRDDQVSTRVALLRTQCAMAGNAGDAPAALAGYTEARQLAQSLDDPALHALLDEDIGRSYAMLGEHELAIEAFRRTLDAGRTLGDPHMEARSHLLLGVSYTGTDPKRALVLFDEGERVSRSHDLRRLQAYFPFDRGKALALLGSYPEAAAEFARGIELSTETGDQVLAIGCQLGRARSLLRSGNLLAGAEELHHGLRMSVLKDLWPEALGAALDVADMVRSNEPDREDAAALAHAALHHPNTLVIDKVRFGPLTQTDSPDLLVLSDLPLAPTRLDEFCEMILATADSLSPTATHV